MAIFLITCSAVWLSSAALLQTTSLNMPWRYVFAMVIGYGAFFVVVRVWADFQKNSPYYQQQGYDFGVSEAHQVSDGGGFIFAVIILTPFALILGGILSVFGTVMLLEVAFEVAFAGAMVRSAWGAQTQVGQWARVLLRKTFGYFLLAILVVFSGARFLQNRFPKAQTLGDTLKQFMI